MLYPTKVKEKIVGNFMIGQTSAPVTKEGFTAYIEFDSVAAALDFPTELEVDEEIVHLWHRGKRLCSKCNKKGHSEEFHDALLEAKSKDVKRKKSFRARKQARAQARNQV